MPTKYVAVTIAGAVSLGSYEAGAMFEILEAIRQHNDDPETQEKGDFVRIDVLTGASAGGMTAAILAQRLLYQKDDFAGPYDNPLYDCWVKDISIQKLVDTVDKPMDQGGDLPALLSLFSSARIEQIAQSSLCRRDGAGKVPVRGGASNMIDPDRGIRLGLALTNINGMNYGYPMFPSGVFRYTDFSDQMLRKFSQSNRDLSGWQEIGEAGIACGAFPFAFRTKQVTRDRGDYESSTSLEPWPNNAQTYPFTYTDGGALQNQPLGMAKALVDLNDHHLNQEQRFYFFISPSPMCGQQDCDLRESNTNIGRLAGRFIDIYMGQAAFRDWIQVEAVNAQIRALDARVEALARAIERGRITSDCLEPLSNALLAARTEQRGARRVRAKAVSRLAHQYREELGRVGQRGTTEADAFLQAALALEEVANLQQRDLMPIYGVVTESSQLAGAGVWAFVGFLNQAYRDHDYDRGRTVARQLLQDPAFSQAGQLGPLRYQPAPIRRIDPKLDGLHLNKIPTHDVNTLKAGLMRRVNEMIKEAEPHYFLRKMMQAAADAVLELIVTWEFSRNVQGTSQSARRPEGRVIRGAAATRSAKKEVSQVTQKKRASSRRVRAHRHR